MSDWRTDLGSFLNENEVAKVETRNSELERFIQSVVLPAFKDVAAELEKYGRVVTIRNSVSSASLLVTQDGEEEMTYRVQGRTFPNGVLPFAEVRFRERKGLRLIRSESMLRSGAPDYRMTDISVEEVIRNFLDHYKRRVQHT